MKAWMTGPVLTPWDRYRYDFWTSAPWPFYHAGVTFRERDDDRAEQHLKEFVEDLRQYLREE